MPDVDRSGRVVRLPAGQVRRRRAPEASDLTRRLAALERQVERALTSAGASPSAFPSLETVVDAMLLGFDRARRALTGEPEAAATLFEAPLDFLYRRWWRVEVIGRERLPRRGPVLVVANRVAAALPYDAPILARALSQGTPEPRVVVPLLDAWLLDLPLVGAVLTALGACAARGAAARRVLAAGETAVAFPEGSGAIGKPLEQRYRLAPFRQAAVLRAAADAGVPVVPVAVIGAEEAVPVLGRIEGPGRWLGLPVVPISPLPFPLPTKWTMHVGEPLEAPAAGADRRAMRAFGARVRERLQGLVSDGVRRRPGLFA